MIIIEGLEVFKSTYKPKDKYSIILFITTDDSYFAGVFERQEIEGKKDGLYVAELSIVNIKTNSYKTLVSALDKFIVTI